jgi:hypothetical protein
MYDYYYNNVIPTYGRENFELLFTDTGSFCKEIKTTNIYENFIADSDTYDMSDYPKDHKCYNPINKIIIEKFKDETHGNPILEFAGLKAKIYAESIQHQKDNKIAKGCKKSVVENDLNFEIFKNVLHGTGGYFTINQMNMIRSKNHQLSTVEITKVGLCAYDDKSYILEDGINTLAFGHYKISHQVPT